jgi:ABC-2 type transport system ATP-binding protein
MIEARAIRKRYDTVTAVDGLSFKAEPGRIFGLIGPNGAGKSTTIRMLMNIIAPDEGFIQFDGKPMAAEDKDRIGYLPEERGLYKKAKVNETLLYLAGLKGADKQSAQAEIDRWLAKFELLERKQRKIEELSKGMAQKVQFIGSIAHRPSLLFLDEPFSGLDPVSQEILLSAMLELKDEGRTILFSTHIMEQAEKICSDILLINKGKAVVAGPLAEVKASFGKNSVLIEFDGDGSFIKDLPCAETVTTYPRYTEVALKAGSSADELFKALAGKVSVRRFELSAPSLHRIFISLVGGKEGKSDE